MEAARTPTLASLIRTGSLKASSVTKRDMVKPMPARVPAPDSCPQVTPSGRDALPLRMISQLA